MNSCYNIKVCGLTSYQDFKSSKIYGANFFGFIIYEESPRYINIESLLAFIDKLPLSKCVFVDIDPEIDKVKYYKSLGCKLFQIHTARQYDINYLSELINVIGKENIWLAPNIKNIDEFNLDLFDLFDNFLLDTFSNEKIGGTGHTGNWDEINNFISNYSNKFWVLAGGLNTSNITKAITSVCCDAFDVNSGIESSPGNKDPLLMKDFFKNIEAIGR